MNDERGVHSVSPVLSRRGLLLGAGAVVVATACGSGDDSGGSASTAGAGTETVGSAPTAAPAPTTFTAADFEGLATCLLLPEAAAGPFPLDEQLDRQDVTEGYPGRPLRLGFRAVDDDCAAIPGAAVEIWHADVSGDYSAFTDGGGGKDEAEGTTFLRGTQIANDEGIVEFLSVVPGWYPGRTPHIHLRVHVDDETVLTTQLYFDEGALADVYAGEPYAEFGPPDTTNEADGLAGDPEADGTLLDLAAAETDNGPGTVALLNLGVEPS